MIKVYHLIIIYIFIYKNNVAMFSWRQYSGIIYTNIYDDLALYVCIYRDYCVAALRNKTTYQMDIFRNYNNNEIYRVENRYNV